MGHCKSLKKIVKRAAMILPNSEMEYLKLVHLYSLKPPFIIIPNGIDEELFAPQNGIEKDENMVLCVARIEGLKNQMNLIRGLNHSKFQLFIIGNAASNQLGYYRECKKIAAENIHFIDHLPQQEVVEFYKKAKVHILPSWFETCGLSTLEAAAMGCNVVITDRGFASEYCNGHAFYCDPSSPSSMLEAVETASRAAYPKNFQQKILTEYTWQNAANKTYEAYKKILF